MKVAVLLLAYAFLLGAAGMLWLRRAAWVDRAPKLGLFTWQALTASIIGSVTLAGLAVAVPVRLVSGGLAELLHACAMALQAQYATPGGAAASLTGAVLAVSVLGRGGYCLATTWRTACRDRRRQLETLAMIGRTHADSGAMIVDHREASVYCLPGRRGRIVLTSAALHALAPDELRAVLAHERAHLRQRHDLAVAAATALAKAFGRIQVFTVARDEIARLAELAADDAACKAEGRIPLAEALLAVAAPPEPTPALSASSSHTGRRIRRLLTPASQLGRIRLLLGLTIAGATLAVPLVIAAQPAITAQHLDYCPITTSATAQSQNPRTGV